MLGGEVPDPLRHPLLWFILGAAAVAIVYVSARIAVG